MTTIAQGLSSGGNLTAGGIQSGGNLTASRKISGGGGGISFGQTAAAKTTSTAYANCTVGFSSPSAAGTYIVATATSTTSTLTISNGTGAAWTEIDTGSSYEKCWVKKCNGSEPANYTVTISGASKSDGATVTMMEVLGANSTGNPDNHAARVDSTSTGVPPSATSSAASDACVTVVADSRGNGVSVYGYFTAPPAGFTLLNESLDGTAKFYGGSLIAGQLNCGSGTISPGAWSTPNTSSATVKMWTITFKA